MESLSIRDMSNSLFEHSAVINNLAFEIQSRVGRSICRVYTDNIKYKFGNDIVEPDVSIVCGIISSIRTVVNTIPKVVIEVLSKSTEQRDRNEKMQIYLNAGVTEYWLVDWTCRSIEIYLFEPNENDENGQFYLIKVITDKNKEELYVLTLPHVKLDFDEVFNFYM